MWQRKYGLHLIWLLKSLVPHYPCNIFPKKKNSFNETMDVNKVYFSKEAYVNF